MIHNSKRILLVGGGTGGHVTPLIAVIEELLASGVPSSSIFLVTDPDSARIDYIQGHQIEVHTIISDKFNRFFALSNLIAPFRIVAGFFQSLILLRRLKPDVILAKGAYLSAPLVYAATKLKIPIYLHESDSVMGASNRRLAKYAQKIFVTFPLGYYEDNLKEKLVESGLPIRKRFFNEEPISSQNQFKKILVWGGSQGADRLNRLIIERLSDYLKNFEIYHIAGEKNFEFCQSIKKNFTAELQERYHLYGFLGREIEKVIAGSDIVVSRAGATSLFELAAMGKAVICVPYPYAAANHQYQNAQFFEKKGAALVLEEKDLNGEMLKNEIFSLLDNNLERNELKKNIISLAPRDASEIIVERLLNC